MLAPPLPTFTFRKGIQQLPISAARPRAQGSHLGSPGAERRKIASPPLQTSPARVIAARHLEPTRSTLLKPGFREPAFRMSMPVPHMATTAKGIAPMKKPAASFTAKIQRFISRHTERIVTPHCILTRFSHRDTDTAAGGEDGRRSRRAEWRRGKGGRGQVG